MKTSLFAIFCFGLFLIILLPVSCSNFYMKGGKAELISVSDSELNDSSIFVGYVFDLNYSLDYPICDAQIWIDDLNLMAYPDTTGYYFIKTVPGTYTVKCQRDFNDWPQLIEEVKNFKIGKNEKVQINFYLGYVAE